MKLAALKSLVGNVVTEGTNNGLIVYVIYLKNGVEELRMANIDEQSRDELLARYLEVLSRKVVDNDDVSLMDIDKGDDRKDVIYNYNVLPLPAGLELLDKVAKKENQPKFSFKEEDVREITGFIIKIGTETNSIILYKKHIALKLFKHEKLFGLIVVDQKFERVREDIIQVPADFDFLKTEDQLFIFNLPLLEKTFGFSDVTKKIASDNVDFLNKTGLVTDVKLLKSIIASEKMPMIRKIMRIKIDSPVMRIKPKDVCAFVTSFGPLQGKLKLNKAGTKIELNSQVSIKRFLSLINDDYLTSELSKLHYEGRAKDPID